MNSTSGAWWRSGSVVAEFIAATLLTEGYSVVWTIESGRFDWDILLRTLLILAILIELASGQRGLRRFCAALGCLNACFAIAAGMAAKDPFWFTLGIACLVTSVRLGWFADRNAANRG